MQMMMHVDGLEVGEVDTLSSLELRIDAVIDAHRGTDFQQVPPPQIDLIAASISPLTTLSGTQHSPLDPACPALYLPNDPPIPLHV